jgi:hypothetical protein
LQPTFINVDAVIEIDKIRQLINARPFQRLSGAVTFADRLQIGGVGPNLRVAIHAGLGRRNAGKARSFNRSMTITAIDAESGDVMLMAERNRLRLPDSSVGDERSAFQLQQNPEQAADSQNYQDQRGPGDGIAAAGKDLH